MLVFARSLPSGPLGLGRSTLFGLRCPRTAHKAKGFCSGSTVPAKKEQAQTPQKVETSAKPMVRRRKPTVEEEIKYTKRYDLKRMFLWMLGVVLGKVAYDAYFNSLQQQLYDDPQLPVTLWEKLGKDCWLEAQRARLVRQRYGRLEQIDTKDIEVKKKRQFRHWNTFSWMEQGAIFMLRARVRLWEDVGTVQITVPVNGDRKSGLFHVRAFTRDNTWVLEKAWMEDSDMIIEVIRRIDMDFLLNPDANFLLEQDNKKEA